MYVLVRAAGKVFSQSLNPYILPGKYRPSEGMTSEDVMYLRPICSFSWVVLFIRGKQHVKLDT